MANFTQPTNISTIGDMFTYGNLVTNNKFGPMIPISIYFIVMFYLHFRGQNMLDSAIAAGFITMITSVLLLFMGLITGWHLFFAILVFVLSVVGGYLNKS